MDVFKIACCALLIFSASTLAADAAEPEIDFHRTAVQEQGTDGLYPAQSTLGRFFVNMPIPFNDFSMTTKDENVGNVVMHLVGGKSAEHYEFTAYEMEITDRMKSPDLVEMINSVAASNGAVPVIKVEHQANRERVAASYGDADRSVYELAVKDKRSVFVVMCEYPSADQARAEQICGAFTQSFTINR